VPSRVMVLPRRHARPFAGMKGTSPVSCAIVAAVATHHAPSPITRILRIHPLAVIKDTCW
jgi:hypothetical protein